MIVAGFGFRSSATLESLSDAYAQAAAGETIAALATLEEKAGCAAFQALAVTLGLPVHTVTENDAKTASTITRSRAALAAKNTGSVAEATALLAAGPEARLVRARVISEDRKATCALARAVAEQGGSE